MNKSKRGKENDSADAKNRGREAERPTAIPRKGWRDILKRTKAEMDDDNMLIIAAGVAFYLLIGIVPGLIALISIYGLIADPGQVQQQFAAISGVLPQAASELLSGQMQRIAGNNTAAGWGAAISILAALWASSSAMKALVRALNIAYDETEKRSFIKLTAITLVLTLGVVATGIVAIGAIVFLPMVLNFVGFGDNSQLIANLIRWPLLALIAVLGLAVLYRFGPNRTEPQWRWVSGGAVVAMLLWVLASAAFSFYVSNFGNYNEMYGSLAAIVIMMLWLYLSSLAVLIGAELNAEMEHQTAKDTTKQPEKRMGKRGAHVADDLGESYA
ncbi:MAG: YihY/virulence factor BrkB family protein [Verrucomicrobia bacterium]|nr:YihY/virulence factor BrkB family protein [Verrucomicrobiota bacterium]